MGESFVKCSMSKIYQRRGDKKSNSLHGSIEEHSAVLKMAEQALLAIAGNSEIFENSQPVLWHSDIHMGNIFVSENDPGKVTGFIDWQNTSIKPLFSQVGWPVFLDPPKDYQKGQVMPSLPEGFDQMDEEEKETALYNKAKADMVKGV